VKALAVTATIMVRCSREGFADTIRRLAWTVGHLVSYETCSADAPDRMAVVLTDLDYAGDEHVLQDLGLDIIGKIDGVLGWEVVPRYPVSHPG
jgi:hypothetical protein